MNRKRRVLFFIPSLSGGGAERVFSNLLRALDRDLFELHLAVLEASGPFMREVPSDVNVHELKISRVRYGVPAILRLMWSLRPDTVLSTLGHLNIVLAMLRPFMPRNVRLILRQAGGATSRLEAVKHPNRWSWAYRRFYRKADLILCQSDFMVNELREQFGLAPGKLVRIYNPVDLKSIWELGRAGDDPYQGPGPNIVTAGRLTWEKGYDVLLAAMPEVMRSCPGAQLHILGQGPRIEELVEQASQLGLTKRVHFLGFQENPWRYFLHADLFVLSSRSDAQPNAVLEALALGTPVVATDCPGSMREIRDCDRTIMLVPPENAGELAKAIVASCQGSPAIRAGQSEVRARLRRFDLQAVARQYSEIL